MRQNGNVNVHVERVRRFNRFYTRQIGLLNAGFLESRFSLTEVRVLYEIAYRKLVTARDIATDLKLDAGYMSRIVRAFQRGGLIRRTRSAGDRREIKLSLTRKGTTQFRRLEQQQRYEVHRLLEPLSSKKQSQLVTRMGDVQKLLSPEAGENRRTFTFRKHRPGDMGWIVHRQAVLYNESYGWNEELEALMAQITAEFIRKLDPVRERCWIAERGSDILGSIFCVKKTQAVAQLRLLYVEPAARGLGLGTQLVNECVAFARGAGYRKIVLWTNSVLESARRIYEHAGFKLITSEKQHSFGKDVVEETWELSL